MTTFDSVTSPIQSVEIVTVNNGNKIKEYQAIIKNLSLHHMDGKIKMFVADRQKNNILHQGPFNYHLHPVGMLEDKKGGPITMINFDCDIDERFELGIQYFVVFQAETNIPGSFVQTFTSFFTPEEKTPLPTFETS